MFRWFRSFKVLGYFMLICAAIYPLAALSEPSSKKNTGKPAIAFDETNFDFGTVSQQEKYFHVFRVRNIGDQPLKIENIEGT